MTEINNFIYTSFYLLLVILKKSTLVNRILKFLYNVF